MGGYWGGGGGGGILVVGTAFSFFVCTSKLKSVRKIYQLKTDSTKIKVGNYSPDHHL